MVLVCVSERVSAMRLVWDHTGGCRSRSNKNIYKGAGFVLKLLLLQCGVLWVLFGFGYLVWGFFIGRGHSTIFI